MTKHAILESIQNAYLELRELENSPVTENFKATRLDIIRFIARMKEELKHDY